MKKLLALILSILLLTGCAPAVYDGPTQSAWVITEQRITHYDRYTGKTRTNTQLNSSDVFGKLIRQMFYADDELTSQIDLTYDDRGNCTRKVTRNHFWLFAYPISRTDYTYDEQDRLLTTTYRNGFGFKTGSDTYSYDDEMGTVSWVGTYDSQTKYLNENGDILRVVTYSNPTDSQMESIYEYDALGRNTKILQYIDGEPAYTTERRFDDQDRIIRSTMYDSSGTVLTDFTFEYTENTVTTLDRDGSKGVKTLRPDGQPEKNESYDPEGNLLTRTDYTYTEILIPAKEE